MVPKAKMLTEAVGCDLKGAKTPALRTVNRVCHKNDKEDGSSWFLKFALLARVAVQHGVVK
jgi:hypothetical protein